MIDWKKLCEESHQIAKEKGWHDTPRSFDGDIALMHEELSEALSDYRNHKGLTETYYEVSFSEGGVSFSNVLSGEELDKLGATAGTTLKSAKPCGIPTELADLIIRIAQYCGTNGVDLAGGIEKRKNTHFYNHRWLESFESFIRRAHQGLSLVDEDSDQDAWFAQVVILVQAFCQQHNIDLERAIVDKAAFNRTRPHRHGNKKI